MRRITSAVLLTALLGSPAMAATENQPAAQLSDIKGKVLVDTGKGFSPVGEPAVDLALGNRVLVAKGGSATLTLGPNCSIPLQSPSMTTVEEAACVVGTQNGEQNGGGGGGGGGGGLAMALTAGATIGTGLGATAASIANSPSSP